MKRLLFGWMLGITTIAALCPAPALAVTLCGRGQVASAIYYYEQGGPECGLTYFYCEAPSYHQGCTTSYYSHYTYCACP